MDSYSQCNPSSTPSPPTPSPSAAAAGSPPPPTPPSDGGGHPAFAHPEDWEENPIFRATFLRLLSEAAAARAVALGRDVYGAVVEDPHAHGEPRLASELRAAAADLKSLARFVAEIGRERFASELPEYETRLSEQAEGLTVEIDELAGLVDRILRCP